MTVGLTRRMRPVDHQPEEVPQHLFGDVEVGNDSVFHRPDRHDSFRGAAQHPLGLESNAEDVAGGLIDRRDRRLIQDYPLALHEDQRIGGSEVHRQLAGRAPGLPLGQLPAPSPGIAQERLGRGGRRVDIDRYGHCAESLLLVVPGTVTSLGGLADLRDGCVSPDGPTVVSPASSIIEIRFFRVRDSTARVNAAVARAAVDRAKYDPQVTAMTASGAEQRLPRRRSPSIRMLCLA